MRFLASVRCADLGSIFINPFPIGGLKISGSKLVPDGTQIWTKGRDVVDITTNERAAFLAMFGLMRVPCLHADGVVLSSADFESFTSEMARAQ